MLTQPKTARQSGTLPRALQEKLAIWEARSQATRADAPTQRAGVMRAGNESKKPNDPNLRGSSEDWKVERLDGSVSPTTQAVTSLISYKPQKPEISEKFPLARFQNPTYNPEVALLLERYGDLRQVILHSPIFKTPCAKIEDGGWGTGVGGLISLAKQYGLERVLWAIRETKNYRGAREPGKYFNHILRNGLEGKR